MSEKQRLSGWINFYKQPGESSNRVLGRIKKHLYNNGYTKKEIKVGYLGTLDPFAQGLLPIAFGEALKTIHFIEDETKEYEFVLRFGISTDTLDNTGTEISTTEFIPQEDDIKSALSNFIGEIIQIPPAFSAIKVNGERAYKLAREGKEVKIKSRQITIHNLELLEKISTNDYKFRVRCAKGTYVRTLAEDIAKSLNSEGHLIFLERIANGIFKNKNTISLDFIEEILQNNNESNNDADSMITILQKADSVLDGIPVVSINEEELSLLKTGRKISNKISIKNHSKNQIIRCHYNNNIVAICEISEGNELKPIRVFNI